MSTRFAPRVLGVLLVLGGIWGLLATYALARVPNLGEVNEVSLAPLALVVATANLIAGFALFLRPYLGFAVALIAQVPQAFSFVFGSVAYALNLWPNFRIEFIFLGPDLRDAHAFVDSFTAAPGWSLRTDASYFGLGVGVDFVSTSLLVVLLIGLWAYRLADREPNQSFKPTSLRDAA